MAVIQAVRRLTQDRRVAAMFGAGGAAVASQLIVVATTPIATRLFDEAAFGVMGLFIALGNLLSVLAHLGLAAAIIAADHDHEADSIMHGVVALCALALAPICLVGLLMIHFNVMGYGVLSPWFTPLLLVEAVSIALVLALQTYVIRKRMFAVLARSHIVMGASRGGGQVLFGALGLGAVGLCLSEACSRVATTAALAWKLTRGNFIPTEGYAQTRAAIHAYRRFIYVRTPTIFLTMINAALPPMILGAMFSVAEVGLFTLAMLIMLTPIGFLQKAIGDVFSGYFAEYYRAGDPRAGPFTVYVALGLLALGAAFGLILALFGPWLFALIFGENWRTSGEITRIMAPMIALMITIIPISSVLGILKRPEISLYFDILRFLAFIATYLYCRDRGFDLFYVVAVMTIAATSAYAVYAAMIARICWKALSKTR